YIRDFMTNGLLARVERNPEWFRFLFEMTLNNPELYAMEQGAAMGIGTARSLANIFQKAIFEKAYFRMNPKETLDKFLTPYILKEDIVTGANVARGNGMMFSEFEIDGKRQRMIGHAGYGGQNIKFDTEHELVFCYLSNGLKVGFGDSARTFVALRDAIYRSVFAIEASANGKVAHH
ncbi:LACT-4 protein, partial [Aphelenchoides avenae]